MNKTSILSLHFKYLSSRLLPAADSFYFATKCDHTICGVFFVGPSKTFGFTAVAATVTDSQNHNKKKKKRGDGDEEKKKKKE